MNIDLSNLSKEDIIEFGKTARRQGTEYQAKAKELLELAEQLDPTCPDGGVEGSQRKPNGKAVSAGKAKAPKLTGVALDRLKAEVLGHLRTHSPDDDNALTCADLAKALCVAGGDVSQALDALSTNIKSVGRFKKKRYYVDESPLTPEE